MTRLFLVTSVAATALLAGSALADCRDISELNEDMVTGSELAIGMRAVGAQDVRKLRDAAHIFAAQGDEEACEDLVEDIREMLEDKQEMAEEELEEAQEKQEEEAHLARLAAAQPLASIDGPLQVQTLVGRDLHNHRDEVLGEIDAVVVTEGGKEVTHILVSHGGIFGIGAEQVAVPWNHVNVTEDGSVLVLRIDEESFDEAPSIDRDDHESIANVAWNQANDAYFDEHVM